MGNFGGRHLALIGEHHGFGAPTVDFGHAEQPPDGATMRRRGDTVCDTDVSSAVL